jgi:hypothetical protein
MIFQEGRFQFDFTAAVQALRFDEMSKASPHYHGLSHCMKAVDFIVEREHDWLFIEVKDFTSPGAEYEEGKLQNNLIGKFRDTFLYRWAENKMDKEVKYICVVEPKSCIRKLIKG